MHIILSTIISTARFLLINITSSFELFEDSVCSRRSYMKPLANIFVCHLHSQSSPHNPPFNITRISGFSTTLNTIHNQFYRVIQNKQIITFTGSCTLTGSSRDSNSSANVSIYRCHDVFACSLLRRELRNVFVYIHVDIELVVISYNKHL